MELKSMKLDKKEQEEMSQPMKMDRPEYPYGLCICLDNDSIEKLGLPALPAIGQKMMVHAQVEVTSISQYDSKDGGKNSSMSLQITDMALEKASTKVEASKIYDSKSNKAGD